MTYSMHSLVIVAALLGALSCAPARAEEPVAHPADEGTARAETTAPAATDGDGIEPPTEAASARPDGAASRSGEVPPYASCSPTYCAFNDSFFASFKPGAAE